MKGFVQTNEYLVRRKRRIRMLEWKDTFWSHFCVKFIQLPVSNISIPSIFFIGKVRYHALSSTLTRRILMPRVNYNRIEGEEGMKGPALNNNYHGNYDKPSFRVPFLHPSRAFLSDYYLHSLLLRLCSSSPLLFFFFLSFLFFFFFFFIPPPGHGIPAFR